MLVLDWDGAPSLSWYGALGVDGLCMVAWCGANGVAEAVLVCDGVLVVLLAYKQEIHKY